MAPLSTFTLPLPSNGPPIGYGWEERDDISVLSTTTAFNTAVARRDTFLGKRRCVVCGERQGVVLQNCHVIDDSEPEIWYNLKTRRWIPPQAKEHPRHEPRDGLVMCANHHLLFDGYSFFIRFVPDIQRFVFVNYSNIPDLAQFHGKAIALDIKDRYAPFPSLFILHEMRVRGFHPFQPINPEIGDGGWQDWIYYACVFDDSSGSFKRNALPNNECMGDSLSTPPQPQLDLMTMNQSSASPGRRRAVLNEAVINDILSATRASPSWRACQMEGTSWTGTADENIQKYFDSIGTQEP